MIVLCTTILWKSKYLSSKKAINVEKDCKNDTENISLDVLGRKSFRFFYVVKVRKRLFYDVLVIDFFRRTILFLLNIAFGRWRRWCHNDDDRSIDFFRLSSFSIVKLVHDNAMAFELEKKTLLTQISLFFNFCFISKPLSGINQKHALRNIRYRASNRHRCVTASTGIVQQ